MLNSHSYITSIMEALLTAEHRRLEANVLRLHNVNKAAWGRQGDGFIFQGEFFVPKGTPNGQRVNLPTHDRIQREVVDHIADKEQIGSDSRLIQQLLFKLLSPCFNLQDIRDATPECVVDTLPKDIQDLDRCRLPTFFLNHPRDFRLYEAVLPKLEFYSAARLLY